MLAFKKDYFIVSVDLRGCGESDCPPLTSDYNLSHLSRDIIELIPALGYTKCTALVGHDLGGAIAWATMALRPDLVKKLIIMNCPHLKVLFKTLSCNWAQRMKSWYMFMVWIPKLPEFIYAMRDYAYFNFLFQGRKIGVRNPARFPPEIVEAYKYVFSQPGALTPPINYIRCIFKLDKSFDRAISKKIENETLLIWGDCDQMLESSMADDHSEFVTNLSVKHIPDCSHWVQQDAYEKVNQLMAEFLEQS
jgi:pimeloyl-ACP methyl ester carboxylesterase